MTSSFVVVVCHGSYHTPNIYQPFLDSLNEIGIDGYCPQLPTSDLSKLNIGDISSPDYERDPPPGGYPQPSDDIEVVMNVLNRLIVGEGKNVVLCGHSSGGFVATASALPKFQAKHRIEKGLAGGLVGIFYACGLVIPVGESIHNFLQPKDGSAPFIPPWCKFHEILLSNSPFRNSAKLYKEARSSRPNHYQPNRNAFLQRLG